MDCSGGRSGVSIWRASWAAGLAACLLALVISNAYAGEFSGAWGEVFTKIVDGDKVPDEEKIAVKKAALHDSILRMQAKAAAMTAANDPQAKAFKERVDRIAGLEEQWICPACTDKCFSRQGYNIIWLNKATLCGPPPPPPTPTPGPTGPQDLPSTLFHEDSHNTTGKWNDDYCTKWSPYKPPKGGRNLSLKVDKQKEILYRLYTLTRALDQAYAQLAEITFQGPLGSSDKEKDWNKRALCILINQITKQLIEVCALHDKYKAPGGGGSEEGLPPGGADPKPPESGPREFNEVVDATKEDLKARLKSLEETKKTLYPTEGD